MHLSLMSVLLAMQFICALTDEFATMEYDELTKALASAQKIPGAESITVSYSISCKTAKMKTSDIRMQLRSRDGEIADIPVSPTGSFILPLEAKHKGSSIVTNIPKNNARLTMDFNLSISKVGKGRTNGVQILVPYEELFPTERANIEIDKQRLELAGGSSSLRKVDSPKVRSLKLWRTNKAEGASIQIKRDREITKIQPDSNGIYTITYNILLMDKNVIAEISPVNGWDATYGF